MMGATNHNSRSLKSALFNAALAVGGNPEDGFQPVPPIGELNGDIDATWKLLSLHLRIIDIQREELDSKDAQIDKLKCTVQQLRNQVTNLKRRATKELLLPCLSRVRRQNLPSALAMNSESTTTKRRYLRSSSNQRSPTSLIRVIPARRLTTPSSSDDEEDSDESASSEDSTQNSEEDLPQNSKSSPTRLSSTLIVSPSKRLTRTSAAGLNSPRARLSSTSCDGNDSYNLRNGSQNNVTLVTNYLSLRQPNPRKMTAPDVDRLQIPKTSQNTSDPSTSENVINSSRICDSMRSRSSNEIPKDTADSSVGQQTPRIPSSKCETLAAFVQLERTITPPAKRIKTSNGDFGAINDSGHCHSKSIHHKSKLMNSISPEHEKRQSGADERKSSPKKRASESRTTSSPGETKTVSGTSAPICNKRPSRIRKSDISAANSLFENAKTIPRKVKASNLRSERQNKEEVEEGTTWSKPVTVNESEYCLTTSILYNTSERDEELLDMNYQSLALPSDNNLSDIPVVEVPTWREMILTKSSCTSGLEDMDDSAFQRRHQKLEVEERRRKRWDAQRLREEQYLAKLKARNRHRDNAKVATAKRSLAKTDTEENAVETAINEFDTLQPKLQLATSLRVEDDLPIAVYGFPLPIMDKTIFELPWELKPRRAKRSRNEIYCKSLSPPSST